MKMQLHALVVVIDFDLVTETITKMVAVIDDDRSLNAENLWPRRYLRRSENIRVGLGMISVENETLEAIPVREIPEVFLMLGRCICQGGSGGCVDHRGGVT